MTDFYKLKPNSNKNALNAINNNPNFPYGGTVNWVDEAILTIHGYYVIPKIPDYILSQFNIVIEERNGFLNTFTDGIVTLTKDDFINTIDED